MDEVVGWNHQLNGHEFEQTPGDSEGQGSLVCCSPRGYKELDTTETEQQQILSIQNEESVLTHNLVSFVTPGDKCSKDPRS